jgi:transcriptional regulator with XRE-family HTH domain
MYFGEKIKELRKKKNLTLRALAEKVDLDFTYLSKIENGKVDYTPSSDKIRSLANVLDADELELLKLADKVPPELEPLANNPRARAFFRRAQSLSNAKDWDDLIKYLDKRQEERERQRKGKKN